MEFGESARLQLAPLIETVLEQLDPERQILESSFFTLRLIEAKQMAEPQDLLHLFLELSTTAFQGFSFTAEQASSIDQLLAVAENISHTLTAPSEDAH